jgi:hypothetical protein
VTTLYLSRPLNLDLQEYVGAGWRIRDWRAVKIAMKFSPFVKAVLTNRLFKRGAIDKDVLDPLLARTNGPRGPRSTEPQLGITINQNSSNGPLADTAGTYENEN